MAIIWIDIWDSQSSSLAKMLINQSFNIGSYVATICSTNMNPSVLQCKNCWKQGHTTFTYCFQDARCLKCNGSHKLEHHQHFACCYKANFKINPPHLKTKQGEPCPYLFKYINCKSNHQVDSNSCLFWYYYFNKEWHVKNIKNSVILEPNQFVQL